jgi:hypothetical protein
MNISSERYASSCELILVDTIEERLVVGQPSLTLRYVALSYVWGGVAMPKTTMGNIEELQKIGGLDTQNFKLPQTVRDAMTVVTSLGERYLWVDTLCIIHDDEQNKDQYISRMDM